MLLGNFRSCIDFRFIRFTLCICLSLSNFFFAFRTGNCSIFLEFNDIIHTQIFNYAVAVHEILHIKTDNIQTHSCQIGFRIFFCLPS